MKKSKKIPEWTDRLLGFFCLFSALGFLQSLLFLTFNLEAKQIIAITFLCSISSLILGGIILAIHNRKN